MPLEDKEQILNDIFNKVKESSSTIKSLFSMEKKQQKVSSNVIAQQEEKNSEEEVSRDEEKQYRIKTVKLLEEIRDQGGEVGGAGGGGLGGLLGSLLGDALGGIVTMLTAALAPLLAGLAAAGLGTLLYEKFIKPELDKYTKDIRKDVLNFDKPTRETITDVQGNKLFSRKNKSGELQVVTEKQKQEEIQKLPENERDFAESNYVQLRRNILPGGTVQTESIAPEVMALESGLPIEKYQEELQKRQTQKETGNKRENTIKSLSEVIIDFDKEFRDTITKLSEKRYQMEFGSDRTLSSLSASALERETTAVKETLVNSGSRVVNQIIKSDLSEDDKAYLLSDKISPIFKNVKTVEDAANKLKTDLDSLLGYGGIFTKPLPANMMKDEIDRLVGPSSADASSVKALTSEIIDANVRDLRLKREKNESILDAKREKYDMDSPLKYGNRNFANEGIIEGTRRGSRIIAGENYTSEAVVSTKPNTVTETIGKNLYDIIKQSANSDISSTQRQSTIITDALKNTIQSYYDMTKISQLNTQGGQTIVNNFVGGMGGGNMPETNAQFNSGGLTVTNTETVLQKVYMDAYKAALL